MCTPISIVHPDVDYRDGGAVNDFRTLCVSGILAPGPWSNSAKRLVSSQLAEEKYPGVFVPTEKALEWYRGQEQKRITFADAESRDSWPKGKKYTKRWKSEKRLFPYRTTVELIADGFNGIYKNEDGEFSSKELTAWYVEEFCRANYLKV